MKQFNLHDLRAENICVSLLLSGPNERNGFHFGTAVFRAGVRAPPAPEYRERNARDFLVVLAGHMTVDMRNAQIEIRPHEGLLTEAWEPVALEFHEDTLLLWGLYGEEIDFPPGASTSYWTGR